MRPTPEAAAFAHFEAGRIPEAEAAWREILAARPDHPDALHLLGYILATTGRAEEGLAMLERAIALAPPPAAAGMRANRAIALHALGRLEEAERDLRRALELDPRIPGALQLLGNIRLSQHRFEEAAAAYRRVLAIDARIAPAHVGLGITLARRGDRQAAAKSFLAALEADPRDALAHYHLGVWFEAGGELARAEGCYRNAVACDPANVAALNDLGSLLRQLGREAEGRGFIERALAAAPAHPDVLNNMGLAHQAAGESESAIDCYRRALAARPGFAGALVNWGNALQAEGRDEEAIARYRDALGASPGFAPALICWGNVLQDEGRLEEAASRYAEALASQPGLAEARYAAALVALRRQRFAEGWADYEARFATRPPRSAPRAFAMPRLQEANLGAARRVAVWAEQGLGDQLLYSTLLPELEARGLAAVVEVDPRLAPAYRRRFPKMTFVDAPADERAFDGCDAHVPIASLGGLFRGTLESFASQPAALLSADPEREAAVRAALGPGRWIGISWRSLQGRDRRLLAERKSIPLEAFAALAGAGGARLLDLQHGEVSEERERFAAAFPDAGLHRLADLDATNDLEGVLASLACCERVVTASNALAHLAGAMGRPTWLVYLGGRAPFHYWQPGPDARSLWYPSVEIVSDPAWPDWPSAFAALAAKLEADR